MTPEFHYTTDGTSARFAAICESVDAAQRLQQDFPALEGSPMRRSADVIWVTVPQENLDDAILTLEKAGYVTVNLDSDPNFDDGGNTD